MELTDKINVDIISDVMCPWCVVGYKRFEKAVQELGVEDKIQVTFHPFELNPNIAPEGEEMLEHLSRKYGMTIQQARDLQTKFKTAFDEVNFPFEYQEGKRMLNTLDAHVLLDYAKDTGKQIDLKLALFKAYFAEQKDISKKDVLKEIVKSVGLNTTEAMARLNDSKNHEIIKEKETYWMQRGINSVPTMVFNQKSMINGAYPVENYKQILTEVLESKTI